MPFYSAANCKIVISVPDTTGVKSIVMKEAHSIEWTMNYSVVPVYSWKDKHWNRLAEGTILVNGSLIINVDSARYLVNILNGIEPNPTTEPISSLDSRKRIQEEIRNDLEIVQESIKQNGGSLGQILAAGRSKRKLLDRDRGLSRFNVGDNPTNRITEDNKAFNQLYTLQVINNILPDNVESIIGVRFTGKAVSVNTGNSQNIKYAFPFVAQDATI